MKHMVPFPSPAASRLEGQVWAGVRGVPTGAGQFVYPPMARGAANERVGGIVKFPKLKFCAYLSSEHIETQPLHSP